MLEFLGFGGLTEPDRLIFTDLLSRITVVDLNYSNTALMEQVAELRKTRAVKLPDAIVMASASLHGATVITNDAVLLKLGTTESGYTAQAF